MTGRNEPWDADSPYYFVALAVAGAVSGAVVPKHLGRITWERFWGRQHTSWLS